MNANRSTSHEGFSEVEKARFMENLIWAQQIVETWSPQMRVYNSIGYPEQQGGVTNAGADDGEKTNEK